MDPKLLAGKVGERRLRTRTRTRMIYGMGVDMDMECTSRV